jgi:hypothetical protein
MLNSEILRDYVTPKVEELKNIFVSCGEEMEWTAIEKAVYGDTKVKHVSEINLGLSNFKEIDRSLDLHKKLIKAGGSRITRSDSKIHDAK